MGRRWLVCDGSSAVDEDVGDGSETRGRAVAPKSSVYEVDGILRESGYHVPGVGRWRTAGIWRSAATRGRRRLWRDGRCVDDDGICCDGRHAYGGSEAVTGVWTAAAWCCDEL
ncbi:polyketide cyclase/dehydrase and lipid transportsuperfamily protein [Striga asiatica]|uniref:Polyketide cyclase/dehydrase and lipid transportsuperfamily protein n=1 Tax=Striga asiatica TaxID=4170 RepID=A0A5A7QT84_STRAF|nr:polyketide cyclase/dehydrase and lipid transportsuperfamily protein [Striga asiatica]